MAEVAVYRPINDVMVESRGSAVDDGRIVAFEDWVSRDWSTMVLSLMFAANVYVGLLRSTLVSISYTVPLFVVAIQRLSVRAARCSWRCLRVELSRRITLWLFPRVCVVCRLHWHRLLPSSSVALEGCASSRHRAFPPVGSLVR